VNGAIGVRTRAGVRICDRNSAEWLPAHDPGLLFFAPIRIEQWVVTVSVAVRLAVHGNAVDVAGRIEPLRTEHSPELIADVAFERHERGPHQFSAARPVLLAHRKTRLAGC